MTSGKTIGKHSPWNLSAKHFLCCRKKSRRLSKIKVLFPDERGQTQCRRTPEEGANLGKMVRSLGFLSNYRWASLFVRGHAAKLKNAPSSDDSPNWFKLTPSAGPVTQPSIKVKCRDDTQDTFIIIYATSAGGSPYGRSVLE